MMNKAGQVIKTLASVYNSKPFGNPNDAIADNKGGVYISDPDYTLTNPPQDKTAVYYIDPAGKGTTDCYFWLAFHDIKTGYASGFTSASGTGGIYKWNPMILTKSVNAGDATIDLSSCHPEYIFLKPKTRV
jgi:hypothetical protein